MEFEPMTFVLVQGSNQLNLYWMKPQLGEVIFGGSTIAIVQRLWRLSLYLILRVIIAVFYPVKFFGKEKGVLICEFCDSGVVL